MYQDKGYSIDRGYVPKIQGSALKAGVIQSSRPIKTDLGKTDQLPVM